MEQSFRTCLKTWSARIRDYFLPRKRRKEAGNISLNIASFFPSLPRGKELEAGLLEVLGQVLKKFILGCLFFNLTCAEIVHAAPHSSPPHHSYVSEDAWQLVTPYLMPENHPLKSKLDRLFSKRRVLASRKSLVAAGFEDKRPEPQTKVIVTRHRAFKGYIFKIYTDDRLSYYRDEPEYITWMLRARGAKLVRKEIRRQGWQALFKAPKKWIYPLPPVPTAASHHLQKNFILVEEEMDILSHAEIKEKWQDGTMTTDHLDKLFFILKKLGLRGGCKFDNIPICKDGRIAFIDTQNNLRWPVPYERLFPVLGEPLRSHWENLIKSEEGKTPMMLDLT